MRTICLVSSIAFGRADIFTFSSILREPGGAEVGVIPQRTGIARPLLYLATARNRDARGDGTSHLQSSWGCCVVGETSEFSGTRWAVIERFRGCQRVWPKQKKERSEAALINNVKTDYFLRSLRLAANSAAGIESSAATVAVSCWFAPLRSVS